MAFLRPVCTRHVIGPWRRRHVAGHRHAAAAVTAQSAPTGRFPKKPRRPKTVPPQTTLTGGAPRLLRAGGCLDGEQVVDHGDRGGADQDHEDPGKDEEHEREDEFDGRLRGFFLGDLASFNTH